MPICLLDAPLAAGKGFWSLCATLVERQEQSIVAVLRKPAVLGNLVPRLLKWLHCNRTCHPAAMDLSPSTKDCCAMFPA